MVDLVKLKAEVIGDPISRGYAGMTDLEVSLDGHLLIRDDSDPPTFISAATLWNAFDPTEYDALGPDDQAVVDFIGDLGSDVPVSAGLIKNKVFGVFGSGTTSRANIIALTAKLISRWNELEIGFVREGHVATVRMS